LTVYTPRLSLMTKITQFLQFLGIICVVTLAGCASTDEDITAGWSQSRLLNEAKSSFKDEDYPNCVKYYEKLESRYPFGPMAEQAQLNIAFCNWKRGDIELAQIAINRFIQLHPGHPEIDYAYYLKGLITFNDNLGFFATFSAPAYARVFAPTKSTGSHGVGCLGLWAPRRAAGL